MDADQITQEAALLIARIGEQDAQAVALKIIAQLCEPATLVPDPAASLLDRGGYGCLRASPHE